MKRRLLSGLVAALLLFSLVPTAVAANTATESEQLQVLSALEIMTGNQDGDMNLGGSVTRAEFTKMAVAASQYKEAVGDTASVSPYPDVPKTNWAAPWVQAGVAAGLVRGNLKGYFEPSRNITLAEGVTIALRLLGHQDSEFTGAYPAGQMAMYRALSLDKGITNTANGSMSRRDAMNLFYNLMTAKTTTGAYYLNTIRTGASASQGSSVGEDASSAMGGGTMVSSNLVNSAGEINRVALINTAMEGPVVTDTDWQSSIPFTVSTATVYRDGVVSSLSAVGPMDVVYYSKSMRTIWAYNHSVTGTVESLTPSASNPTSVTVAGKTYAIENTSAAFDLSDLGQFKVGESATLLLGRDSGVAAVRKPGTVTGGTSETIYGVVTGVSTGTYKDSKGNNYQSDTVLVKTTAGGDYTYSWTSVKYFKEGDLVRITTQNGDVQVKRMSMSRMEGKVSRDGKTIGSYTLADNVNILETYGKTGILRIFPSRLAGMTLTENMVKFYARNAQGEISDLILNDATGDLHDYGILTGATEISEGLQTSGTYACVVGGAEKVYSTTVLYKPKEGPVEVKVDGGAVDGTTGLAKSKVDYIKNLTEVKLDTVDGNVATGQNNQKFTISDGVQVYEYRDNNYYLTDLIRMTAGNYSLTGYYEKPEADGGRIRIVIARAS